MTTPTTVDLLADCLLAADDVDVHALVPVALIRQATDDLADLYGRIEQATLNLEEHFHAPRFVDTSDLQAVTAALYVLAGEPDGADL